MNSPERRETREEACRGPTIPRLIGGHPPHILAEFGVTEGPPRGRLSVPLWDETGTRSLGIALVSLYPRCATCRLSHEPGTSCGSGHPKCLLPTGFGKNRYVYNKFEVLECDSAHLCVAESFQDVWRLQEAGQTAVSLLGCYASKEQAAAIAALARPVVIAFNNHPDAERGRRRLAAALEGLAQCTQFYLPPSVRSVADMDATDLNDLIRQTLDTDTETSR